MTNIEKIIGLIFLGFWMVILIIIASRNPENSIETPQEIYSNCLADSSSFTGHVSDSEVAACLQLAGINQN